MKHLLGLILLLTAGAASAQGTLYQRANTWEFGVSAINVDGWSSDGLGGSGLDFGSDTGWGLFGGYNFTNRLAIQFGASELRPRYRATYVPEGGGPVETLQHTATISNLHVKGTFYILPGRFSPFVEAGLGWTNIDSNVVSGPPITGCWFDPWWGYRCDLFYSTYGSREVSYTTSVGVRWDVSVGMFIRAEYGVVRLDGTAQRPDETPNMGRIAFGWRF